MATAALRQWTELDEETRRRLDRQYLDELHNIGEPGLTDKAIEAYLAYRHERPAEEITTFELGRIRRMLHKMRDPALVPDPVDQEHHHGWLEKFGAKRLHLTYGQTYVWGLMLTVLAVLILVWFAIA
jgi:hypothetical protein